MLTYSRFLILLPLAYALVLTAGMTLPSESAASAEIGEVPPDYLGKTIDGVEIRLSASSGKIRIVTFWATWCAPCLKELPVLNAVQQKGGSDRIQIVAVNINDRKNDFRRAVRVLDDYEIEFVFDYKKKVSGKYDVEGIPHMLIIDVDGRVAFRHVGYSEEAIPKIVAEINDLLVRNNLTGAD